jgi:hypothetical protein
MRPSVILDSGKTINMLFISSIIYSNPKVAVNLMMLLASS